MNTQDPNEEISKLINLASLRWVMRNKEDTKKLLSKAIKLLGEKE